MEEARGPVVLSVWSRGSVLAELACQRGSPGRLGGTGGIGMVVTEFSVCSCFQCFRGGVCRPLVSFFLSKWRLQAGFLPHSGRLRFLRGCSWLHCSLVRAGCVFSGTDCGIAPLACPRAPRCPRCGGGGRSALKPPCAGVCLVNTQELDRVAVPLCFCENLQGGCPSVRPCLRLPGPAALGAVGTVPTGASHGPQRQAHPPGAGSESAQCALRAHWLKMSVPLLGFSSTVFLFNLV